LGTDTWFYAKRCFVALLETLSKHMVLLKDQVYQDILRFFDSCEFHGRDVLVTIDPMGTGAEEQGKNSVSYEARLLKSMFLRLYE
jgi:tetratricopeptide repeat protein 30